ncbi:MAG: hypothetical protein LCH72_09160 [Proteobacteria bacterium]|nr:hypothetical protein [Burkholderiales bacterium]MCA0310825.1 hypothetical protein [Pseudomonadota bacterium]
MTLILLEALGALLLFVLLVWWTMFSGREKGELPRQTEDAPPPTQDRTGR